MATGTGNLPNKSMSFTPFDILTAEEQNDLVENIESLATGTGIGDGAITTAKIATEALTRVFAAYADAEQNLPTTATTILTLDVSAVPTGRRLLLESWMRVSSANGLAGVANTQISSVNGEGVIRNIVPGYQDNILWGGNVSAGRIWTKTASENTIILRAWRDAGGAAKKALYRTLKATELSS